WCEKCASGSGTAALPWTRSSDTDRPKTSPSLERDRAWKRPHNLFRRRYARRARAPWPGGGQSGCRSAPRLQYVAAYAPAVGRRKTGFRHWLKALSCELPNGRSTVIMTRGKGQGQEDHRDRRNRSGIARDRSHAPSMAFFEISSEARDLYRKPVL